MEHVQIDWLTIFIAAILNMVIGAVWYSKWLFGPLWMKLEKQCATNRAALRMGSMFLISLVIAYFLAFFESFLGITTVSDGMFVGFCFWLGFVVTTQISRPLFCGESLRLFWIHTGSKLLSFLVMSGVIGA